ncbi:helix-turn-helix domain-containing protein, partial [Kitasatospora purpeofusca]|uniref:helix-turn-helix domain-containing protein n=1 Tax=Kitasatospora purpeofusca TaxID=67352 RepID=UPI0035DD4FD2
MGRQECPLDPAAGPVERFASELRKLRGEAGNVTYRVLAGRTRYSVATLSRAAGGQQLPSLPVVLAYAE